MCVCVCVCGWVGGCMHLCVCVDGGEVHGGGGQQTA